MDCLLQCPASQRTQVHSVEITLLKRTPTFWIAVLALAFFDWRRVELTRRRTQAHRFTGDRRPQDPRRRPSRLYSATRAQARKATLARARAVAMAREMAETVVPRYKVDASGDLVPDLRAAAAIIYNPETNEVLWEENSQSQRSIASITKVMTATVFLENSPDLTQPVTIARSDVFQASTTHLRANDKVTTDDLLHLLLIASDNAAARALARVSPHGSDGFIDRMNAKAAELGLAEHALRRSVRPAVRQRLVGLRHGAADRARLRRRAHRVDHADADYTVHSLKPRHHLPQHQSSARP